VWTTAISLSRRRKFLRIAGRHGVRRAWLMRAGSTPWRFLTAAEGRTLDAICEQIIPTDQTPGQHGREW